MQKLHTLQENSNNIPLVSLTARECKNMTKNLHKLMARAIRRFRLVSDLRKLRS